MVHGLLFYSPTCGHCHEVMNVSLPPILDRFGASLEILGVNTHSDQGAQLYRATVAHLELGPDRQGVPMLLVGDRVLLGSGEIPDELPGIVERGLEAGGIDWPAVPAVREALAGAGRLSPDSDGTDSDSDIAAPVGAAGPGAVTPSTMARRFLNDPVTNSLAVAVLLGMLAVLFTVGADVASRPDALTSTTAQAQIVTGALAAVGLAIAAYLAFSEASGGSPVCGPLGDCAAVQSSVYSRLFGVVHVGVAGVAGYGAMLVAWLVARSGPERARRPATAALWILALAGTIFSIYLTFLEPFVIGATCLWCLGSAVVVTAILWTATRPAPEPWGA